MDALLYSREMIQLEKTGILLQKKVSYDNYVRKHFCDIFLSPILSKIALF
jgi:hypothetical protein